MYLSVICRSVLYLSVFPSIFLSVRMSVCLSVYMHVFLSICLSVCLPTCLSVRLSICMYVCLSVYHQPACLSVCLSFPLAVCLSNSTLADLSKEISCLCTCMSFRSLSQLIRRHKFNAAETKFIFNLFRILVLNQCG